MRDIILKRIAELKKHPQNNGFDRKSMRWSEVFVGKIHVSRVDFATLDDADLLSIFELIVAKHYRGYA